MKLSSLKTVKVLNSKSLELISGGLSKEDTKKKDCNSNGNTGPYGDCGGYPLWYIN